MADNSSDISFLEPVLTNGGASTEDQNYLQTLHRFIELGIAEDVIKVLIQQIFENSGERPDPAEFFSNLPPDPIIEPPVAPAEPPAIRSLAVVENAEGADPKVATGLTFIFNWETIVVTDPAVIKRLNAAVVSGDNAEVAAILGKEVLGLVENPNGADGDSFENVTVTSSGSDQTEVAFDHEYFIFDVLAGPIAESEHHEVTLEFTYAEPAAPIGARTETQTVALSGGRLIEIVAGEPLTAQEIFAAESFDWAGASGGTSRQFEASVRAGLGDALADKIFGIEVVQDGEVQGSLFAMLTAEHSSGNSPYGRLNIDGAGFGADVIAIVNTVPAPDVSLVANVTGPDGEIFVVTPVGANEQQLEESTRTQIGQQALADAMDEDNAADPSVPGSATVISSNVDAESGTVSVTYDIVYQKIDLETVRETRTYTYDLEEVSTQNYTATITSPDGGNTELAVSESTIANAQDAVVTEIIALQPAAGIDPASGATYGEVTASEPEKNEDGSYTVTTSRTVQDAETGDTTVKESTFTYTLSEPSADGRRLREVDGVVSGTTAEEVAFDASSERVAVLWQGLVSVSGGQAPNMSPAEVFAYVAGVYLGSDAQFTNEQMAAFFAKNLDANGNLAETLDLSMFEGHDPATLNQVFQDGAQLFHSLQANAAGGAGADGPSLIFAPTEYGAKEAFVNALQTDLLQTGTTQAASTTEWQDSLISGISSESSVLNGDFTEGDRSNDALVKAIAWVGADVIPDLQKQGLWTGPSAAELDSATLAEDHPIYDVIYTPEGETESVHVLATQQEFDNLLQQHEDGKITLQTSNIQSDYVSDPGDAEIGGNEFRLTYVVKATGETVVLDGVSAAERDALVAQHEAGEIIILPPKLEDPNQVKLVWAEKALAVYDATQVPVYDAKGNIVSGGDATARVAQAYVLFYEQNAAAAEPESYGPGRTGTRLDPLLTGGPDATASSMNDAEAINFLFNTIGRPGGADDLYTAFGAVTGVTDIVHVAGHWAQNRVEHPDHTFGEWLGGGNKDQAQRAATEVEASQEDRGRTTGNVDAAVTDTDREIDQSRVLTGLNVAFAVLSLGADAALLAAAEATAAELGVDFTSEEGISLLQQSFQTLSQGGRTPSLKDAVFALVESGNLTKEQAVQYLAQQSGSDPAFWQALGANGAGYATAGAVGVTVGQSGVSGNVIPIANTNGTLPDVTNEGGLSQKEHLEAIALAAQTVATADNVGSEAAGALLYNSPGTSAVVVEQALELMPPELRAELIAYRDGLADDGKLSSLIAGGDADAIAAYIKTLPPGALQYDAIVAVATAGDQGLALQVLAALPEEAAANILIYEQSANLNATQSANGTPADPLDTSGPIINALFDLASVQPEAFKEDFGGIIAKVVEISPDMGAHILYTALRFRGTPDGSGDNADLAATLLTSVDEEKSLLLLNALDELQVDNGPRRDLGEGSSQVAWASLSILAAVMRNTGDFTLTFKHELAGDYQNGDLSSGPIADYAATSPEAKAQVDRLNEYIFNPFSAFSDPKNGAELGEYALLAYGYDNAAQLLNNMPPEEAAGYLDQVSPTTFLKLIAGMDVESALEVQPFLAASQNFVDDPAREAFILQLSEMTGVAPDLIRGMFDGTLSLEAQAETGAYNVIPVLFELVQAGDPEAIKFVNNAVDTLIAAGGSGDPDKPGGWGENELAILKDLRDAASGSGDYEGNPSVQALSTLLTLLSTTAGAAVQIVTELADVKFVPEAVFAMGVDGIVEQNPELAEILENPEAAQAAYLEQIANTDEGRALLDSYGYQVIEGELYYADRGLQATPTGSPTGTPSVVPTGTPSWNPSLSPSLTPTGSPSVSHSPTVSAAPTVVPESDAQLFFQNHGRLDIAVEATLIVGPGATVRQVRVFVTIPVAARDFENGKWGLRVRQLTAVGPEGSFGDAGNWVSTSRIGELAGRGAAYVDRLAGGIPSAIGNGLLGVAQLAGLPERASVWGGDISLSNTKDFAFTFYGADAVDAQGNDITGIEPEYRYLSNVGIAAEAANAENGAFYQVANFIRGFGRTGEPITYAGTDIPVNEVVSYRHAESNFNGAEAAYRTAVAEVTRLTDNNDLVSGLWTDYQNANQAYKDALAAERTALANLTAKEAELTAAGVDTATGQANVPTLHAERDAALLVFQDAQQNEAAAQATVDALNLDHTDPTSAYYVQAETALEAAQESTAAAREAFGVADADYSRALLGGTFTPEQTALYNEYGALQADYAAATTNTAAAQAVADTALTNYSTAQKAWAAEDPNIDAAENVQTNAQAVYDARGDQFATARGITQGVNAGRRAFNAISGNVDTEAGYGFGWGAAYHSGSTDPDTGQYTKDNNFSWQVGGDIGVSVVGGAALTWAVGASVAYFLPDAPPAQTQAEVLGFARAQEAAQGFFAETLMPAAGTRHQGVGLVGSYAASTIYTAIIAPRYDNIDYASEYGGWAALQGRGKLPGLTGGLIGDIVGKTGGRFQVNFGWQVTGE